MSPAEDWWGGAFLESHAGENIGAEDELNEYDVSISTEMFVPQA